MKKYINSITLALVAILMAQSSFAQSLEREVINSCGGTLAPPGGPKLTQNIGETFATRLTGGGATLTQGYLQNTTSVPAAITGTMSVCAGNTTTLSFPVGGGTWSSTTPSVATVGSTGIVTGIAAGTSIISYVTGSTSVVATITVQAVPATITGTTNVCVAATTTLSSADAGGVWSSSNPAIASIGSATGIATGVSAGSVQVSYTFPSGCFTTRSLSVNPLAHAGVITGSDVVCPDNTIPLSTTATGGTWSSSNAGIASVDEFGLVYGAASGTATISYVLPGTCGSAIATKIVTVSTFPTANPITGVATVCMGNTTTLSNTSPGGIWSSSNTAVGSVSATGIVTGISVGSTTISYIVTTDCGTALTTRNVTVTPGTVVGALTGSSSICTGSTTTLSSTTSGGTWNSSNPEIASVGSTGIVTGNAAGTATISYSTSGSCGIVRATKVVSVNAVASVDVITGTASVCTGNTTSLSNATTGGTWTSSTPSIAYVGSTGIVTGIAAGTTTISYTVSSECGTATATKIVTVNAVSSLGSITGLPILCAGSTTTLSNSTAGGSWSSNDVAIASVGATGTVTGNTAGTATISYSVTGACGTAATTRTVSVQPLPAIGGTAVVCEGSTTTLTSDTTVSSLWSSFGGHAWVDMYGVVTGVSAGTAVISLENPTTGCMTTQVVTVNQTPSAISAPSSLCTGATGTLSASPAGGTWLSDNTTILTVNATTGEYLSGGTAGGIATVSYQLSSGCSAMTTVSVTSVPCTPTGGPGTCGTISVTDTINICGEPSTTIAASASPVGTIEAILWTPSTGLSSTTTASTTFTGTSSRYYTVTMMENTGPNLITNANFEAGNTGFTSGYTYEAPYSSALWFENKYTITTNPSLCHPESYSHTDHTSGTGKMMCINGASTPINVWTQTVNVTPNTNYDFAAWVTNWSNSVLPSNCPILQFQINGSLLGQPDTILTPSGTWRQFRSIWNSGTSTTATIVIRNVTTAVIGNDFSLDDISFRSVCTAQDSVYVNVGSPAPAITVSGEASVCAGNTKTFNAATTGTWSSSNTAIATVASTTGVVTGVAAGTATISFHNSTNCYSTRQVTVNQSPSAIAATTTLCIGATGSFTSIPAGGTWISNNTVLLAVNATSGEYLSGGTSGGVVTVSYQLANGCSTTTTVSISSVPCPGICGTMSVPDTVNVCGGSSTPIIATTAPTGTIDGILWTPSTGLSSTTTASTTFTGTSSRYYTVTMMENTGPNLITNANFEAGNTGFTSGYTYEAPYSSALWFENKYTITTNPSLCHPESYSHTDHTSGTGKMMCVNGASTPINVWTQTVNVTPNTNYDFAAWVTNWSNSVLPSNCPILQFQINGSLLGQPDTILTPSGTWRQFRSIWNSGTSTTATIVIRNVTTAVIGNDFSLDDISFRSVCVARDSVYVNVGSPAPAITVSGEASVCAGSTKTFSAATTGTWSSSNTAIATVGTSGTVTGNSAGTATISFHTSSDCFSTRPIAVNPAPSTITGNSNVCIGTPFAYSNTTSGGVWSRTATPSGAFAINTSTGLVTASATGTGTITYAIGSCSTTKSIAALAQPNAITGTATMCVGSTTTLTSTTASGTWSSSNEGVATVAPSTATTGIVSGVSAGTATIYYTNAGGCARAFVVTVTAAPPAIGGGPTVCLGGTITLTNATTGGTWSSSTPSVSSISSISGIARGNAVGNATITYAISATCRTTSIISVTAAPSAITGANRVCIGSNITLAHETTSGTWSSSTPAKASVSATSGVVTGLAAGTTTITYATGSAGCFTTKTVSVNALPSAIGGTATVCEGANTTLTNATSGGGIWSNDGANAIVSTTGSVAGIAAGTSVITFEANTTSCRTTRTVTINTTPASIGGTTTLCIGSTTTLTSTPAGGTWQSSNMTAAPINASTGSFTAGGTASASAIISYTMPTGCRRTIVATISALPGALSGGTTPFCVGNTTNITAATASLTWSSANTAVATVVPLSPVSGQVTGLTPGTATISYTNSTGCARTVVVTVSSATSDITGPDEICVAGTATMTSTTPGGTWTSSNTAQATILSATGIISGVSLGGTTITYRTSATCYATKTVNVVSSPSGTITGPSGVCIGSDVTFTYPSTVGTWVSSNTSRATINSATGLVAGVAQGTLILTYNLAPGCYATKPITVYPYVFPISGTYSVCVGSTAMLNVAQTGGTWTISNSAIGTLSYAGAAATNLTGLSAGTATVTYLYPSTGCYSLQTVTVQALPMAITGPETVCVNAHVTLANGTPGGTWTSSAGITGTVNASTGEVSGVSAGMFNITYTAPNACMAVKNMTTNPLPGNITGVSTLGTVTNTTATLNCTPAGGEWTSSNTGVATIGLSSGVITSAGVGTTTITYTIPATGCFRTRVQTVVAGRPMAGTTGSTDAAGNTRIFPTPTTGMLTVEAAVSGNFKVMTIDGRIVAQYPINAASTTINLPSDLAAGIYMCRFEGVDGIVETLKVVLTK